MHEKFKSWLADDTYYFAFLLILVGFGSFGLGRLSVLGQGSQIAASSSRVHLMASSSILRPATSSSSELGAAVVLAPSAHSTQDNPYVGSKAGTKYYLPSCAGAKRIKDANKVFFASKQAAAAAGYEPSSTCSGL